MITEDQLVRDVFKKANTKSTMKDIDVIVKDCFDIMKKYLKQGKSVYISELGTFAANSKVKKSFVEITKVANKK